MSSPRSSFRSGTAVVLVAFVLFAVTLATSLWGRYLADVGPLAAPVAVVVNPGEGTIVIARKLHEANVIAHPLAFRAAVRLMALDTTLKAGEYQFDPGISLRSVVNKLAVGDTQNRSVTIPEGWTVRQVMGLLASTEGLTGNAETPAEGQVFPDTYAFRFGVKRSDILKTMTQRMDAELEAAWSTRAAGLPLNSPEELLNLASIVQKEAANDAEMPQIAAVFINRLKTGMKLQADPTVIYGADYDGNIRRKDLTEPHPFNTYIYAGLPPTPIANPGKAALEATARPAQSEALFFMARPDRSGHVFSATYAEHKRAVEAYWKAQKNPPPATALAGGSGSVSGTALVSSTAISSGTSH